MPEVHVSLLNADFSRLEAEAASVATADAFHLDVMDGVFVPADTRDRINPALAARLPHETPKSVHLMVEKPVQYFADFARAGATEIVFHVEAAADPLADLKAVRALGLRAGLSLKPGTSVSALHPFLKAVDTILVMSVEPGKGGQAFLPEALDRIRRLRALAPDAFIEVDGGVKADNAAGVIAAGADAVIVGTGVFAQPDRAAALAAVRDAINRSRAEPSSALSTPGTQTPAPLSTQLPASASAPASPNPPER